MDCSHWVAKALLASRDALRWGLVVLNVIFPIYKMKKSRLGMVDEFPEGLYYGLPNLFSCLRAHKIMEMLVKNV